MKKFLLIFTIMLTFSISTVSVSAATDEMNPSSQFTNILGDYGSFSSDSDSDGMADGFTPSNASFKSITDGVQKIFAVGTSPFYGVGNSDVVFEIGHVYYGTYDLSTNASNYNIYIQISKAVGYYELSKATDTTGTIYGTVTIDEAPVSAGFGLYMSERSGVDFNSTAYFSLENFMIIDLTAAYGSGNEPTAEEFHDLLKVDYFSDTAVADQLLDFSNTVRVEHYMYDVPNMFEDFPNNITMENIIRVAFFIPLMIIFYLLIPLFNFVLGGTASGSIMLGLLILAFILREVIRFIDPDFHLFGKNSYYEGFNRPPPD